MNKAYLLIGGNMGNRYDNLKTAKNRLGTMAGRIIKYSHIYETAAWGIEDQPAFLNQAVLLETDLNPFLLLQTILQIEQLMGRKRDIKFGPRNIDIDILLFNDQIIKNENLIIPHPQLRNRKFALIPLQELAPDILHPENGESIEQLIQNCNDILPVNKKNENSSI